MYIYDVSVDDEDDDGKKGKKAKKMRINSQ